MEYRGYKIEPDNTFGHKLIKPLKGALPNALKGSFTNVEFAKRSINLIVDEREPKNAEAVTTS